MALWGIKWVINSGAKESFRRGRFSQTASIKSDDCRKVHRTIPFLLISVVLTLSLSLSPSPLPNSTRTTPSLRVGFPSTSATMSWQSYIDDHLMADVDGNHLTSSAIIGHDGSVWAQSSIFPQVFYFFSLFLLLLFASILGSGGPMRVFSWFWTVFTCAEIR